MVAMLKPTHLGRYKDIAWLLFKHGRSELVDAAGLESPDAANGHSAHAGRMPKAVPTAEAKELADDLEKMGPVFVKIGQLLSTRPDILPPAYTEALARLQDHVEPIPYEDVEKVVREELGMRLSRAFASFEREPVSAASLGQVHRAVMRDGRQVAVKVQRPGIREKMTDDLDSLHEIAEFFDKHTEMGKRHEFVKVLEEMRKTLIRELDYRAEAQNLRTLGANLAEFDRIVVPRPIEDYCTTRVLTMDYVSGYKLTALSPLIKTELDGSVLAEQLFQAYLKQILVDGFFHADPHPGNILLTQESNIALIDLGMVGHLSPRLQEGLLQVLLATSEGRGEDAADYVMDMSEKKEGHDEHAFKRQVMDLVSQNRTSNLQQIAVGRVVLAMSKLAADCGIRVPQETTTLAKTLLNLDEVGRTLDPTFNPNEAIQRNSTSLMKRRVAKSFTPGSIYSGILEAKGLLQHIPGKVSKILDHVAENNLSIKVDAIDEAKLMNGFQKVANRITTGLVLAALIIGAAMLMRIETRFTLLGYPGLAIILFLMAAAGAIILLFQILFYDEPTK
jgi:ubiquinone biosynthesis protein